MNSRVVKRVLPVRGLVLGEVAAFIKVTLSLSVDASSVLLLCAMYSQRAEKKVLKVHGLLIATTTLNDSILLLSSM